MDMNVLTSHAGRKLSGARVTLPGDVLRVSFAVTGGGRARGPPRVGLTSGLAERRARCRRFQRRFNLKHEISGANATGECSSWRAWAHNSGARRSSLREYRVMAQRYSRQTFIAAALQRPPSPRPSPCPYFKLMSLEAEPFTLIRHESEVKGQEDSTAEEKLSIRSELGRMSTRPRARAPAGARSMRVRSRESSAAVVGFRKINLTGDPVMLLWKLV
ncbi:hypothetical protein EVAR_96199_1 [Eumeta japonica]|uniref:Uncharacterized protein n=1 Tax=Eumeta variegata TaxID=151549 RepID=A0A4C1VJX3_EUMVA|nr:hypothetical protein EVAR_96199_1 [Eumeta japonica]